MDKLICPKCDWGRKYVNYSGVAFKFCPMCRARLVLTKINVETRRINE